MMLQNKKALVTGSSSGICEAVLRARPMLSPNGGDAFL